jgi:hypothetical protein
MVKTLTDVIFSISLLLLFVIPTIIACVLEHRANNLNESSLYNTDDNSWTWKDDLLYRKYVLYFKLENNDG